MRCNVLSAWIIFVSPFLVGLFSSETRNNRVISSDNLPMQSGILNRLEGTNRCLIPIIV